VAEYSTELLCFLDTVPSFEQISHSITDLLMDSSAAAADADDNEDAECCDELLTDAALSAEYQQISTWCWVSIRVSCGSQYMLFISTNLIHDFMAMTHSVKLTLFWEMHTHACTLVDGTSMNEECVAVNAVGSIPRFPPRVDRQVCAVRFLT